MPEEREEEIPVKVGLDLKWIITIIVVPVMIWCVSIEVRLNSGLSGRVANLEEALQPVLIEYGVQMELQKRGLQETPAIKPAELDKIKEAEEDKINRQFPNMAKQPK